tara:strand:+ start:2985 stop:3233 length:249 start_codon:yes stop_codon:yes gene_type:complete
MSKSIRQDDAHNIKKGEGMLYRVKMKYDVEVWHDVEADDHMSAVDSVIDNCTFNPETVVRGENIQVSTGMHKSEFLGVSHAC